MRVALLGSCLGGLGLVAAVMTAAGCRPSGSAPGGNPKAVPSVSARGGPGVETSGTPSSVAMFVDRAVESGIDFRYRNGQEAGLYSIVESLGGGIGLLDWDRDGDQDLWLRNRTSPRLRLMINGSSGERSVLIRLEGVECNRDGIGAVVQCGA